MTIPPSKSDHGQLRALPESMLRNFVARYESGGVQPHPVTSFVDARGRACIVGALAGARSLEDFAASEACRTFLDGPLVEISRRFEDGELAPARVYEACLLELARRTGQATIRKSSSSTRPVAASASRTSPLAPGAPTAPST